MKRFICYIFPLVVLGFTSFSATAQNKFSESDRTVIDRKVDSLISEYLRYSSFISENDLTNISEDYLTAFPTLFTSPSAPVVNDLDFSNSTPKTISVAQYVDYVREWYPNGFSVDITNIQKDPDITSKNGNFQFTVNLVKTLGGFYKQQEQQNYEGDLHFVIEFDRELSSFKIAGIDPKGGTDTCAKGRQIAKELLASGACPKAKKTYLKVLDQCMKDPEAMEGLKKCDSCMEANKKPFFLTFHVIAGSSGINMDGKNFNMAISSGSGFNLGLEAGIGAEMVVVKSKKSKLSVGLMIDYSSYSGKSLVDTASKDVLGRIDIDGDTYTLKYKVNSLTEINKLTCIQIPVYIQYELLFSKAIALYIKAGGKFGVKMASTYNSTGKFNYRGEYPDYGNVILYDLPAYNFGTYATSTGDKTNSQVNTLDISVFGGLGLNMSLTPKLDLFIGVDYTKGFSDIGQGNQANRITTGKDLVTSLTGVSKVTTQSMGVELGLKYKIFKY